MRRIRLLAPLVLLCVLLPACGSLGSAVGLNPSAGGPDPRTAIALSILNDSVYLVDPSSGAIAPVVEGFNDFQSGYASWAPDHRLLAYGNAGIFLFDPLTNHTKRIVRGQDISMPAWSQDGKQIVFGDGTSMSTTTVARPRPNRVFARDDLAPFSFDWSDTHGIVFEGLRLDCTHAEGCFSTNESDLWTVKPNGSRLTRITHSGGATNPEWSPDGSRILFVRTIAKKKARLSQLWTMNANGSSQKRLLAITNAVAADWSPSGDKIAVVRTAAAEGLLEVWIANADGTGLHPIATGIPGTDATVSW